MNIVILDSSTLGDVDFTPIKELGKVKIYKTTKSDELAKRIQNADVIITNKVVIDKKTMQETSRLKLICIAATGMNNVDLESAALQNIEVKNVEGYSTKSVATHTFSMLFRLLSSSSYFENYVKSGEYEKSAIFTHLGREFSELDNKVWGIIGLGSIGKEVAKIATSFGCQVKYYSTSGKNNNEEYERVELVDLLKNSDIISIHSPLNEKTLNLISKNELHNIKENTILLNLGRGGIINEKDLVECLEKKKLYVGLDVLENEPLSTTSVLKKIVPLENVYITPHIAWASKEARVRLIEKIVNNIKGS